MSIAAHGEHSFAGSTIQGQCPQGDVLAQFADEGAIDLVGGRFLAGCKRPAEGLGHELFGRQLMVSHPERQGVYAVTVLFIDLAVDL